MITNQLEDLVAVKKQLFFEEKRKNSEKVYSTSDYRKVKEKQYQVPEDFPAVFGNVRGITQSNIKRGHKFLTRVVGCSGNGCVGMKEGKPVYK